MNIIVHLSIASQTYQAVRKKTDTRLILPMFMLGSILPDLDRRMSRIPHEINTTMPLVESIVTKISNQFCESSTFKRITKSLQMGVICHFISDYFCNAHTSRFTGNIIHHHAYELLMIWHIQKSKRYMHHQNFLEGNDSEGIFVFLEHMQVLYLSKQADFITDLSFAVNCASILIERLTKMSQKFMPNALAAHT